MISPGRIIGVPVYWLVDPDAQTVTVFATTAQDSTTAAQAPPAEYREIETFHEQVEVMIAGVTARVDLKEVW